MEHTAKFFVGQIVHHKKFDYRGVVFDVDATFQGTDKWYELVAISSAETHAVVSRARRPGRAADLRGRAPSRVRRTR